MVDTEGAVIRVRFTTSEFNVETQQWVELPVAELIADGEDVSISGPHAEWISPDIAIIDPETAERVARADGAERWAQLLPYAYRSGDLDVEVTALATAEPIGAAFHYSSAA